MVPTDPFVILCAGVDAVDIIRIVQGKGFPVVSVDADPHAPGFDGSVKRIIASCYDADETLLALGVDGVDRISGVLCGGVDAPYVQSAVATHYQVVGPTRASAAMCMNKLLQKRILAMGGVRVPKTIAIPGMILPMPRHVVLKPPDSRGARGVYRLSHSITSDRLTEWVEKSRRFSPSGRVLAQEWIEGDQLSTESLVQDGQVLWTSIALRNYSRLEEFAPHVIEDGSDLPWSPSYGNGNAPERKVHDELQKCVTAIGLVDGTLKGDLVYDGAYVWVIEVAPRLSGGSFCSVLTPAAWDIDFVGLAVDIALGHKIAVPDPVIFKQKVRQRFDFPRRPTCHPERGAWRLEYP